MAKATHSLFWFSFLFICGIALLISCSDNSGSSQQGSIEITRISPDSGAVGTRVTVYSNSIDMEHARNRVEINGTTVPILNFGSNRLVVEVSEGISSGPVTLEVNNKVANGPYFKVLTEGPVIEAITPDQGGPGTQVTITGNHFLPPSVMAKDSSESDSISHNTSVRDDSLQTGSLTLKAKGEPSPSINGLPVSVAFGDRLAPLLSLSTTEVIAEVPEGATGGPITLTVGDQTVTSSAFRLTHGPVISEVNPTAGPAGTKVTISGHYFAPHPDSNRVTVNGRPAQTTKADSTSLVATIPEGVTTGPIELITRGQAITGPTFTVTEAPLPQVTINDMSPKTGPVGTAVTINGQNFSATASQNTVTFNGTRASISSASETSLEVIVPEGATNGPVKVGVNGQRATGPSFSVTADPDKQLAIATISPKEGPVGTNVTISGTNVSSTASENIVTFNGTEASVQAASTTELTVTVPEGATTGAVKVAVGSQTAEGPTFTVTEAPVPQVTIEDLTPKEGPVGTNVTITGTHFSGTASQNTVTFNGTRATISSASETTLEVSVPQGATNGPVKVEANGQTTEGPTFTVRADPDKQLTIGDISPKKGPEGTPVTITGTNFSATASDNAVRFNGTEATISSASTTELVAAVPQGATTGTIIVEVGEQTATGPTFTVTETPVPEVTIDDLSPKEGPAGTTVTINGQNFPPDKAGNTVTFNGTEATIESASKAKLVATVPEGATNGPVNVTVGNQTAEGPTFTVTEDPDKQLAIDNISPKEGPVGTPVTITGVNFSATAGDNAVTFNGSQASLSSASTTQLVATVPKDATGGPVTVKVGDQTATGPTFTVTQNHAPTITSDASFSVDENSTPVGTIVATDPDGDALTYSLAGGADQDAFSIGSESGELTFTTPPDYEAYPGSGDADNNQVYEVTVQVSDGSQSATRAVSVAVQNVAEAPVFSQGRIAINDGENYYAYNTDFTFEPVPAGTKLSGNGIQYFNISLQHSFDPITNASISGQDAGAFSVASIPGGYDIYLSGPTLAYSDSPYEFTVTAENAAGQSTTQTFTLPVQSPFGGGSGIESDPYQVATLEQLQLVDQFLDAHFVQTADIDASATAGWNGGAGFAPIGDSGNRFTGSYDGGGFAINGLTIDRPTRLWAGLFGWVETGGVITAVHLTGVDITSERRVGVLAGLNEGTITGCSTTGAVRASDNEFGGGGLVYRNEGTISGSYAAVTVSMNGASNAGGLVGLNYGTIETSYATGNVDAAAIVGGLVGWNDGGTIETSYATGAVSGNAGVGGLVGNSGGDTVTDSYWDTQTTGQATSYGGTGLTTPQMQGTAAETNMTGFDFTNVWQTNVGDYPTLRANPE